MPMIYMIWIHDHRMHYLLYGIIYIFNYFPRIILKKKKSFLNNNNNYRPISLTCICYKIIEHIMPSQIAKHIAKNNIIINEQHGFRNKLSTITQLINTTKVKHTSYFLTSVKHLRKHHKNLSYPSFTTMALEITHLVG